MHLVDADRVIARPLPVVQALAQGERPFMECGSDGQDVFPRLQDLSSFVTSVSSLTSVSSCPRVLCALVSSVPSCPLCPSVLCDLCVLVVKRFRREDAECRIICSRVGA